jgi:adenosylcobinamide kinase/adenosylcobinamide-phosphate guanylyltransferase
VRVLVLGGIRSGKSAWAESAIVQAAESDPVRYIATGGNDSDDADWSARVAAHRQRRPAHWSTVESQDVAAQLRADPATATLVDDMGGWLVAALDRRDAWSGAQAAAAESVVSGEVDDLLDAVDGFAAPLLLVSPEVGLTVVPATTSGRVFADELGTLNQRLAQRCERVVLVIAGQPVTVKEPM